MTSEERIARLEAQIERLEARELELRRQLAAAQLDQWYGRIEDLKVQAHLAAMDTNDRVAALVGQLRHRWLDARAQMEGTTLATSGVAGSVRKGIEELLQDVRHALVEAKDKATS